MIIYSRQTLKWIGFIVIAGGGGGVDGGGDNARALYHY